VALKHKVQSLINAGWLTFQEDDLNIKMNPLASHGQSVVNAVEEVERYGNLEEVYIGGVARGGHDFS